MSPISIPLVILGILAAAVALAIIIFLFTFLFGLTWKILRNVFRFIGAELTDLMRLVGSVLSLVVFGPLVLLNIVIGRWSASKHFSNAFQTECRSIGSSLYRLVAGNPARLLGLGSALEGVEQRVPQAMAAAPGRDKPNKRVGQFEGYKIIGSLQGGGSGGKLYIAEPDAMKQAAFSRQGIDEVDRVVIKVFSLSDGSSLPQIVRESRALDAAKKLGLVLEHELTPERFFYAMRYVPGDALSTITQQLHAESPVDGLDNARLGTALGFTSDLLKALTTYHSAGLWHKDVKPDNIIIDGNDNKAHLVDFGLITPLRSAMTLTTHGTEYFRDPELVRQALRGVKVHQIDGSKFDVYAAGAVLFSVIENSFPAHGGLSQVSKRCPEALRWIIRRAMTDYDRRYASSDEMLADVRVVLAADDPFTLKPVDLPSVSGAKVAFEPEPAPDPMEGFELARGTPVPPRPAAPEPILAAAKEQSDPSGKPDLRIRNWWSGRHEKPGASGASTAPRQTRRAPVPPIPPVPARGLVPVEARRPAKDQIKDARERARQRRVGAQDRIAARRGKKPAYDNSPGVGVVFAGLLGLAVLFGLGVVGGALFKQAREPDQTLVFAPDSPDAPWAPAVERLESIDFSELVKFPELAEELSQQFANIELPEGFEIHTRDGFPVAVNRDGALIFQSGQHQELNSESMLFDFGHPSRDKYLPAVEAQLLVVSDLPRPLKDEQAKSIRSGLALLAQQGVHLHGDFIAHDMEASIDDVASFRVKRGALPLESNRLAVKSREWLNNVQDYDGVLLLAPDPQDRDTVRSLLVTNRFFTRLDWDGSAKQYLTILSGNGFKP